MALFTKVLLVNSAGAPLVGIPTSLGQKAMAASSPVVIASDQSAVPVSGTFTASASELHLGQVGGHTPTLAVEKTRPSDTSAYAVNDIINESTSAGTPWTFAIARTGGPGSGVIIGLLLQTDQAACVAQCEIDVLNAAPLVSVNDNAECTHLYANAGKRLQTVLMPALAKKTANSDMADAYTPCSVPFKAADNINVYFRLRTLTVFTPASGQKFMITAMYAQD